MRHLVRERTLTFDYVLHVPLTVVKLCICTPLAVSLPYCAIRINSIGTFNIALTYSYAEVYLSVFFVDLENRLPLLLLVRVARCYP